MDNIILNWNTFAGREALGQEPSRAQSLLNTATYHRKRVRDDINCIIMTTREEDGKFYLFYVIFIIVITYYVRAFDVFKNSSIMWTHRILDQLTTI